VTDRLVKAGNIVSVGYMLRYLRCVQKMKQIIHENDLTVMATIARYACAYEAIAKPAWWDKSVDMGPVIEQGTHFWWVLSALNGEKLTMQWHFPLLWWWCRHWHRQVSLQFVRG
jgi:predicted dehydrogenase